jgi:hypothetical protein
MRLCRWQALYFSRTKSFPVCSILHTFAGKGDQIRLWSRVSGCTFTFRQIDF